MKSRQARLRNGPAALFVLLLAIPAAAAADATSEEMVELAWERGCFNCHDLDETVRGPAWRDVAKRYRGDPQAFARLRETVRDGGSGNWGNDSMSANRRVPMEDIDRLVAWLLTLEDPAR